MPRPSGTTEMPAATTFSVFQRVISWPRNVIVPLFARCRPRTALIRVDFPAPFAPIRATISPGRTCRSIFLTAQMGP